MEKIQKNLIFFIFENQLLEALSKQDKINYCNKISSDYAYSYEKLFSQLSSL
jgi:hypothetical protein